MTTVTLNIEEGTQEELKKILRDASFKAEIVEEYRPAFVAEPAGQYEKLVKILNEAKGKDLFKEIEDPSEWQRQIRKEWDRDF